jgi:cell division protein FtsB
MEAILNAPIIASLGGVGIVVYLVWQVFRLQADVISPYRDEVDRLRARVEVLEARVEELRGQLEVSRDNEK